MRRENGRIQATFANSCPVVPAEVKEWYGERMLAELARNVYGTAASEAAWAANETIASYCGLTGVVLDVGIRQEILVAVERVLREHSEEILAVKAAGHVGGSPWTDNPWREHVEQMEDER